MQYQFNCKSCCKDTPVNELTLYEAWHHCKGLGYEEDYHSHTSEYFVVCPQCARKNRLLFDDYDFEYGSRELYRQQYNKLIKQWADHVGLDRDTAYEISDGSWNDYDHGRRRRINYFEFVNWSINFDQARELFKLEYDYLQYYDKAMT